MLYSHYCETDLPEHFYLAKLKLDIADFIYLFSLVDGHLGCFPLFVTCYLLLSVFFIIVIFSGEVVSHCDFLHFSNNVEEHLFM